MDSVFVINHTASFSGWDSDKITRSGYALLFSIATFGFIANLILVACILRFEFLKTRRNNNLLNFALANACFDLFLAMSFLCEIYAKEIFNEPSTSCVHDMCWIDLDSIPRTFIFVFHIDFVYKTVTTSFYKMFSTAIWLLYTIHIVVLIVLCFYTTKTDFFVAFNFAGYYMLVLANVVKSGCLLKDYITGSLRLFEEDRLRSILCNIYIWFWFPFFAFHLMVYYKCTEPYVDIEILTILLAVSVPLVQFSILLKKDHDFRWSVLHLLKPKVTMVVFRYSANSEQVT